MINALPVHVGAAVLQAPVARHVVIAAFPLKVYPALQPYVEVEPVVPVELETVPNVGFDNAGHALAAISLLVRALAHLHMKPRRQIIMRINMHTFKVVYYHCMWVLQCSRERLLGKL